MRRCFLTSDSCWSCWLSFLVLLLLLLSALEPPGGRNPATMAKRVRGSPSSVPNDFHFFGVVSFTAVFSIGYRVLFFTFRLNTGFLVLSLSLSPPSSSSPFPFPSPSSSAHFKSLCLCLCPRLRLSFFGAWGKPSARMRAPIPRPVGSITHAAVVLTAAAPPDKGLVSTPATPPFKPFLVAPLPSF